MTARAATLAIVAALAFARGAAAQDAEAPHCRDARLGFRPDPKLMRVPSMKDIKSVFGVAGVTAIGRGGNVFNWYLAMDCAPRHRPALEKMTGIVVAFAESAKSIQELRSDGTVWESTHLGSLEPRQSFDGATRIASGISHTLALRKDGTVWAWGHHGDCGEGGSPLAQIRDLSPSGFLPRQVKGIDAVAAVSAGKRVSVALRADGSVWWWGNLTSSDVRSALWGFQLCRSTADDPNPRPDPQPEPRRVPSLEKVAAIASGYMHHLALKHDGSVWAWGLNDCGQLGVDPPPSRPRSARPRPDWGAPFSAEPRQVLGLARVKAIAAGARHSLALGIDGKVYAWGAHSHGQVDTSMPPRLDASHPKNTCRPLVQRALDGPEPSPFRSEPAAVPGLDNVSAIAASPFGSIALKRDGTVWVWGWK